MGAWVHGWGAVERKLGCANSERKNSSISQPRKIQRIEEGTRSWTKSSQSVKSYYYLYFDSLTFSHISPTNTDFSGGGPISNVGKVISQACPVFIHSFFCIDIALMMLDKPD